MTDTMTDTTNSGAAATDNAPCAHCGRLPGDPEYCDWQECPAGPLSAAATQATSGEAPSKEAEAAGNKLAMAAFEGRKGHGGAAVTTRNLSQPELAAMLACAFQLGADAQFARQQATAPAPAATAAGIKTWQERMGLPAHAEPQGDAEKEMCAEIADLRAAAQAPAAPAYASVQQWLSAHSKGEQEQIKALDKWALADRVFGLRWYASEAPAAKAEPVATVVSRAGNDLRIGWLRPEQCEVGTKFYTAPAAQADDVRDAQRYRWLRDKARSVDWTRWWDDSAYTTHSRINGDHMDKRIDDALRTTSAAPADKQGE